MRMVVDVGWLAGWSLMSLFSTNTAISETMVVDVKLNYSEVKVGVTQSVAWSCNTTDKMASNGKQLKYISFWKNIDKLG